MQVVDKKVHGGRLYLKKGTIVDVKIPTVCDVYFGDIREHVQVSEGTLKINLFCKDSATCD